MVSVRAWSVSFAVPPIRERSFLASDEHSVLHSPSVQHMAVVPDSAAPDTREMNMSLFVRRGDREYQKPFTIIQPRLIAWVLAFNSDVLLFTALNQAPRCFSS